MGSHAPLFTVEREIGAGATGRVALARLRAPLADLPAGSTVAVKRLRSELAHDPVARETARARPSAD